MIFWLIASFFTLQAQVTYQSADGRSPRFQPLDPKVNAAQPGPPISTRSKEFRPAVPLAQYLADKSITPPKRPEPLLPPQLQIRDLSGARQPEPIARAPVTLAPSLSWEGIQQTLFTPPSPGIAVGPSEVLLTVHNSIARYTREGLQTDLLTFQQWFKDQIPTICPASPCAFFDPALHYDQLHGRFLFLVSAADDVAGKSYFLLSVSNGATFSSGWRIWVLDGTLNGTTPTTTVLDFGQMGFDNQAVYLTGNMFNFLSTFLYAKVRILKKSELYNPATTNLTFKDFFQLTNEDTTIASSLRPVHLRGQSPESSPGIMVNAADVASDTLTLWRIQNPVSANPTLDRFSIKGLWTYANPLFVSQLGSTRTIDPGDTRIPHAILRGGAVYIARNTRYSDEPATVTYDRVDLSLNRATLQARLINGGFFFPAFDVTASLGPGNVMPDNMIAGTNVDAKGALAYLGIKDGKPGEAPFEIGSSRWGDFFSASIDPMDGGLWTYGEYAKTRVGSEGGRWGTWAAFFPTSTSPIFTDVSTNSSQANFINVLRLWRITTGCTDVPAKYCPDDPVSRGQTAALLIRSMLGDNFGFTSIPYFSDVPSTHVFFKYVQKLRDLGITSGCGTTTFCPDDPVTRAEMGVFVVRGKLKALLGDTFSYPTPASFTDVPSTSVTFPYIQKLRELGITTGCTATTFCPTDRVTRGQMAVFLVRAFLN